ncbi:MAG: DNA replication and repair protein RecF, partial [Verrucomicrobiota bacterium]
LLKKGADVGVMKAFEAQMGDPAALIFKKRKQAMSDLLERAQESYAMISGDSERLEIEYKPNLVVEEPDSFLESLEKNRRRDEILHSTSKGPHRDDFLIKLNGMAAADYASEGQQRSTVLALSLAIIRFWQERLKVSPVVLADDVLGELDTERRKRFWDAVDPELQFIASGTQLPEDREEQDWKVFRVSEGSFEPDLSC